MKNRIKKIIDAIISPFVAFAVWLDDSKRYNEDGSWDRYHAKKNARSK